MSQPYQDTGNLHDPSPALAHTVPPRTKNISLHAAEKGEINELISVSLKTPGEADFTVLSAATEELPLGREPFVPVQIDTHFAPDPLQLTPLIP